MSEDHSPSAPDGASHPTETGYYACAVPPEKGERWTYCYVLLTGLDISPGGPWVTMAGSLRKVHASECASWSNMLPRPAGGAHRLVGKFGEAKS